MVFAIFRWSFALTIVGLVVAFWYAGLTGLAVAAILIVLEVSLSFDNAVVNARILDRMSPFWQRLFLTLGVLIAVFGMRLLFPLLVVGVSAQLMPAEAWSLAMEKGDPEVPGTYGYILNEAHPSIAAFGGMFLLMIFLEWLFEEREHYWLGPLERRAHQFGRLSSAAVLIALTALLVAALWFEEHADDVLLAGVLGLVSYFVVAGLSDFFDQGAEEELEEVEEEAAAAGRSVPLAVGKAAFFLFLYLELLDASFSFDGVIGAFAITSDPIIIALGLGVGALYVRSLTVYLVRKGTLADYIYLEHGAHWAIGALAMLLLLTIGIEIHEVITGLIGVGFILSAFLWSLRHNRRNLDVEDQSAELAARP